MAQYRVVVRKSVAKDMRGISRKDAQRIVALIKSLAEKRASDAQGVNDMIERGKQGLYKAAKKYKKSVGADRFQIFALKFIEQSMDNKGGFFSKLFG